MVHGYWGKATASIDWCEDNYVYSSYVAEWWNTTSNIILMVFSFYGVYETYRNHWPLRFQLQYLTVGIVGLGSAMFHATLLSTYVVKMKNKHVNTTRLKQGHF